MAIQNLGLLASSGGGAVDSVAGKTGVVTLAAADITSGTLADARISESSVTQHESALTITESQISDLSGGVADDSVTNAKLANVATATIKGRTTAGTGDPEDLTATQVRTLLNVEDGADVTDATNVTAAGALMDSEVTDLAGIKALDTSTLQVKPTEGAFVDGDKTKLDSAITASSASTLTNKGIDADNNTITNLEVDNIKTASKSGLDATLVTGTKGATNSLAKWNADGDLVEDSTDYLTLSGTGTAQRLGWNGGDTPAVLTTYQTETTLYGHAHYIANAGSKSGIYVSVTTGNDAYSGYMVELLGKENAGVKVRTNGDKLVLINNSDGFDYTLNTPTISGDRNFTLPPSNGTANQALITDGSGNTSWAGQLETIQIACSDLTTPLTTGTTKAYFRMPYAMNLTEVRASVLTAPTGSVLTVDINETGTSVLSTKLTIDATEKTSETASTPAVISDSALADDAEITIDIDGVGSTIAGAGLIVTLTGTRA